MKHHDLLSNRYRLLSHLGSGQLSEVWRAEDLRDPGASIVVKVFAPNQKLEAHEIEALRVALEPALGIKHPHVLAIRAFEVHQGHPFVVMPFCRGGSLLMALEKGRHFSEEDIARIGAQLADGLTDLHQQGVHHGNLHPANVLIARPDHFVLSDYGMDPMAREALAKRIHPTAGDTRVAFAPAYAAPERHIGDGGPSADIFSLGATLYALCMGESPYANISTAIKENTALQGLPLAYSRDLNELLLQSMALYPEDRPKAPELAHAARQYLKQGRWPPSRRRSATSTQKQQKTSSTITPLPHTALPESSPIKRPRVMGKPLLWAGLLLLAALAALLIYLLR